MPELPEVESVGRRLAPLLEGRRFERVEVSDPRLTRPADPAAVARSLEGERVAALGRRGKYLIVRFESGRALLIHLRMTGSLRHAHGGTLADDPHRRAVVRLDDGSDVAYRDIRRFGTWAVLERGEEDAYLAARLGAEPLGRAFTAARLGARLAKRRAPVKSAILDQRTLAGVGNIYADAGDASGGEQLVEAAVAVELTELRVAADRPVPDQDLRDGPAACQLQQPGAEGGIVVDPHLLVGEALGLQERLGAHAEAAPRSRIHRNRPHYH